MCVEEIADAMLEGGSKDGAAVAAKGGDAQSENLQTLNEIKAPINYKLPERKKVLMIMGATFACCATGTLHKHTDITNQAL